MAKKTKTARNKWESTLSAFTTIGLFAYILSIIYGSSHFVFGILSVVFCAPAIAHPWISTEKASPMAKILISFFFLLLCLPSLILPYRAMLIADILLLIGIVVFLVCLFKPKAEKAHYSALFLLFELVLICFRLLIRAFYYSFIDAPLFFFWSIPLVLGIAAGTVMVIKWIGKGVRFWGWLGALLLSWLVFAGLFGAVTAHLNYVLDAETPQIYTAVIEDKQIDPQRKGPHDYELYLDVNGSAVKIEVPADLYYNCEVGDPYEITLHGGAFGKPFYLSADLSE